MSQPRPTVRLVLRYAAFQVPGLAISLILLLPLQWWLELPGWLVAAIIGLVAVKDAILFPFVWKSYRTGDEDRRYGLVGARGIAAERLAPSGYVRLGMERWRAVLAPGERPIDVGQAFRVVAVRGLTLVVGSDAENE